MRSTLSNLMARRDLLRELAVSEVKASTAETYLGWLWWLLDPLLLMLIYWAVVVGILQRGRPEYAPYPVFLLCALVAWKHLASAVGRSARVLVQRAGIIKSVAFPTIVLPLSVASSGFLFFLPAMLVVFVTAKLFPNAAFTGNHLALVQVPALMVLQLAVVVGLCLPVSCVAVPLRDLDSVMVYVLRLGFYLSPGLYGVELVRKVLADGFPQYGGALYALYMANPFAILITGYRDAILYGQFLPWTWWLVLGVEAAFLLIVGYRVYDYYDRRVIKFL